MKGEPPCSALVQEVEEAAVTEVPVEVVLVVVLVAVMISREEAVFVVASDAVVTTSLLDELALAVATEVVVEVWYVDGGIVGVRVSTMIPSLIEPLIELGTTRTDVPAMTWLPIVVPDTLEDEVAVVVVVLASTTLPSLAAVTVALIFPAEVVERVVVCTILPATKVVTTTLGHKSWMPAPLKNAAINWTLF